MSAIVFAGSSQIVATQLVSVGAPGLVMILTIAVINLRHALYGASIAPYLKPLRPAWKWLLAYLLTDEAYAVSVIFYQQTDQVATPPAEGLPESPLIRPADNRHWFMLGAGLALWTSWQLSTAVGISLGAIVPQSWSLDFTLALTFIALVVPNLKDRPGVASALAAGIAAIAFYAVPYKLGLVIAALIGIFVGLLVEKNR